MKLDAGGTVSERMERGTIPEPMSGCHLWIGTMKDNGYGSIRVDGKTQSVHRVAWSLSKGAIQAGKMVLHKCDNPTCVNVGHLYIGDGRANTRDQVVRGRHHNVRKTHCPRGHEYTTANTYSYKHRVGRRCRTCAATRNKAAYAARVGRPVKEIQA